MKKEYIGSHISAELKAKIEAERQDYKRTFSAEVFVLLEEAIQNRESKRGN